jgi:hypothetical protein
MPVPGKLDAPQARYARGGESWCGTAPPVYLVAPIHATVCHGPMTNERGRCC